MSSGEGSGQVVDFRVKAVLCGEVHVGKSSVLSRYVHGKFDPNNSNTVGVEFGTRHLTIDGCTVRFELWDTAGQQRYRKSITRHYYRDADIAVLVYDTTRADTLDVIKEWVKEIQNRYSASRNSDLDAHMCFSCVCTCMYVL